MQVNNIFTVNFIFKTMHKHTANYRITKRHVDNSGNQVDLMYRALPRSNGSIPPRIPSYNTTRSALHEHE